VIALAAGIGENGRAMVTAAYLSFTIAMLVVLLFAWRMRADSVEALERSKADARRGRHAQALAADMANIAQALVISLESIERAGLSELNAEAVEEAHVSVLSFSKTLLAAQYLVNDEPRQVEANAEGWLRVAVAGARGEGLGVRVSGFSTSLRVNGRTTDVTRVLEDLFLGLGATLPPRGFVQVDLSKDGFDLSAPIAVGRALDPRVSAAAEMASRAGWTAAIEREREETFVRVRGETVAPPREPPRWAEKQEAEDGVA
jgi:hypothetical protein